MLHFYLPENKSVWLLMCIIFKATMTRLEPCYHFAFINFYQDIFFCSHAVLKKMVDPHSMWKEVYNLMSLGMLVH